MTKTKKTVELNIGFSYNCTDESLEYIINLICLKFDIRCIKIPLNLYRKVCDTSYIHSDGLFVCDGRSIMIQTYFQVAWNYEVFVIGNTLLIKGD